MTPTESSKRINIMRMRKIIGIGETILDIIFKNEQPTAAVPGGSTFNGIISLGRLGLPVTMITETGNDKIGHIIKNFMTDNGIDNSHVCIYDDGRTAISSHTSTSATTPNTSSTKITPTPDSMSNGQKSTKTTSS